MAGLAVRTRGTLKQGSVDLKQASNGSSYLSFIMAVDNARPSAYGKINVVRVVLWDEVAERLAPLLSAGVECKVSGEILYTHGRAPDGSTTPWIEIKAHRCNLLGVKNT